MAVSGGARPGRLRVLGVVAGFGLLGLMLAGAGFVASGGVRAYALRDISSRVGRPVRVDGRLTFSPGLAGFTVRFARLHVDQPEWAGRGAMISVDQGLVKLPWTVLLGDGRLEDVELDGLALWLKRDANGRANWTGDKTGKPPRPPSVAHIAIRRGRVDYQDLSRSISFQGALSATANAGSAPLFAVDGEGRSEGEAWTGALQSTTEIGGFKAYAFDAHVTLAGVDGGSAADFKGRFSTRGGGRLDGLLVGDGPDLHALAHLTNTPLPRTPAYQLRAQIAADKTRVQLQDLSGRVGETDVVGSLTISPAPEGRRLDGDIRSRSLRISDLLAIVSGGQLTRAPKRPGLLPDADINAAPLRKLSGEIRYAAASVQAPTTPTIRSLQARATFDRGQVGADPMVLDLAHGKAVIHFVMDVRGKTPHVRFDTDLQHADTADFMKANGQPSLQATFDGDIRLQGSGDSLAAAAAHASGSMGLHVLHGRLQQVQASVLSANLASGVASVLGHAHQDVEMSCAVAEFHVVDGEARATRLHMVTDVGPVSGYGGINLGAETIDMTLRPAGPGPDVTAVHIEGPLAHPRATLALDDPTGAMRSALSRLLHPAGETQTQAARCD